MTWTLECEAPIGSEQMVRRRRLHNGLRLVSLVDAGAPILAYQSWFGVGSRHEQPGATGMAHLFEHLMFNQTQKLPMGEFDRRIEATGGDTNAATWVDWTYYRDNVPSSCLDMIAELESERMMHLVLEPEVVEAEREVVINERLQRVDDDVDGFANEELFKRAFDCHPYRWPTIGWMEDIRSLRIADIRTFYERYYAPNNLTLVVVGDFDEESLCGVIEKYYGDMQASSIDSVAPTIEPLQSSERRFEYTKEVSAPRLLNGYKSPGQSHADWPLVMFACNLLAGCASSPLHRELIIEREMSSSLGCDIMPFRDPSLTEISTSATRGTKLDDIQDVIDAAIAKLSGALVSGQEIDKIKNMVETDFWSGLTTIDGKAEALGHYECAHNDFRKLFATADCLANITADDMQRVFQSYFQPEQRTVIRVNPEAGSQ